MSTADEIDRLFQIPLSEFTAKRNELLKSAAGADKARIRAIQKPTVPAWAVNLLFWKRRKAFDRLLDAARKLRVEHGRQLSGKAAEVDAAEARHREALKTATDEIRSLLEAAGEQATPATMVAVAETLQGLPGRDDYGRLTRPLKPQGFEALTGLVGKSGATITRLSTPKAEAAAPKRESEARAKQSRTKEISAAERALRRAEVEERAARAEASRAEMVLARFQRERKELQEQIDAITSRRDQAAVDLDERRRAADRSLAERERLALVLKNLKA